MERLIDLDLLQVRSVLPILLQDRTTNQNIIWATDTYEACGEGYSAKEPIISALVTGENSSIIQPRIAKAVSDQADRTKKRAEVFTPAWICNMMVNHCDEVWFDRKDVFNTSEEKTWTPTEAPIALPKGKRWQRYVDSRRLEITCGEAPFLVSRYDASTGERIPFNHRIGMLDRKLRVVNENAADEEEWLKFAFRSLESVYGYEYQGDNLLIARVNVLMSFMDAVQERWQREASAPELKRAAEIISWNIWQMDGLKGTVPTDSLYAMQHQFDMFSILGLPPAVDETKRIQCKIMNWRDGHRLVYVDRKRQRGREAAEMKFDFVIGNPPYNQEAQKTSTSDDPVYHLFMDNAFKISDKVLLITPARFLMNAGKTPSAWNKKMLSDNHLKVVYHEKNSQRIFPSAQIPGGIVITYHDQTKDFGAIGQFVPFIPLMNISRKVKERKEPSLNTIMYSQNKFDLSALFRDYPNMEKEIGSEGKDKRFRQIVMERFPLLFTEKVNGESIRVLGLIQRKREYRYILRKYVENHFALDKYKVFVPFSNGASGTLGDEAARLISKPVLGYPGDGITQTFIGVGAFDKQNEAENLMKYILSKFCRALLGILKVTQGNKPETWACVPLQNFTPTSDIDWSVSIAEIDRQLYKKYNLSEEEIAFIETHVKEMQ